MTVDVYMAGVVWKLMPIAVTGGVVLLGWGLMKAIVPSKETMMKVGTDSEGTLLISAAHCLSCNAEVASRGIRKAA